MLKNNSLSRNIIIALCIALIAVIALVATARYFIVRDKQRTTQKPSLQPIPAPIPEEVLRSLTPPNPLAGGATTTAVSKETLDSLTPPKNAKPMAIPQSVLDSLTHSAK